MNGIMDRAQRRLVWMAGVVLLGTAVAGSVWATERAIKSKPRNYSHAPILIKRSDVTLVEIYSTPGAMTAPGMTGGGSRVRYANRAGLLPSSYMLEGGLLCRNQGKQRAEAFGLTVVLLDAFHQPVQATGLQGGSKMNQVVETLQQGEEKRVAWQQQASTVDIFEVAVIITRVRFADGSVWLAPSEELVDIF